jgi:hypothetical protein
MCQDESPRGQTREILAGKIFWEIDEFSLHGVFYLQGFCSDPVASLLTKKALNLKTQSVHSRDF